VVVADAEVAGEEVGGFLGILSEDGEGMAKLDFGKEGGLAMPGLPGLGKFLALVGLLGLQQVEAVVKILRLGAGDQGLEELGAVLGQGASFRGADLARRGNEGAGEKEKAGNGCAHERISQPARFGKRQRLG